MCFEFGGKYATFGEWMRTCMNRIIPDHVKWDGPVVIFRDVTAGSKLSSKESYLGLWFSIFCEWWWESCEEKGKESTLFKEQGEC